VSTSELAAKFRHELSAASSVLIGTHLNPDGDALGSALAMSMYLTSVGIENEVICHHPAPRNLRFLPGVDKVRQKPKEEKHDLAIWLDLDSSDRLGNMEVHFEAIPRLIVIDHHIPHQAPGDLRIIDVSASATALILTRLFLALGASITPDMATCLLTGIITDTGSFRFRNTTPEALELAAKLIQSGGDLNRISEEVFQRRPLSGTRLLGHMLDTMQLSSENRVAIGVISRDDFAHAEASDEETEGFVNEMLAIETVLVAAILREPKPGKVRCSMRSRGDLDIAAVARSFGGGGHRNAAGCTLDMPLEEAEDLVLERLQACLASS